MLDWAQFVSIFVLVEGMYNWTLTVVWNDQVFSIIFKPLFYGFISKTCKGSAASQVSCPNSGRDLKALIASTQPGPQRREQVDFILILAEQTLSAIRTWSGADRTGCFYSSGPLRRDPTAHRVLKGGGGRGAFLIIFYLSVRAAAELPK